MRFIAKALVAVAFLGLAGCGQSVPESGDGIQAKPALGFAALFGRAGDERPNDGQTGETRPQLPRPLARVRLLGGDLVVEPPKGYCIDPITAQTRGQRGFALIASCRILSGGKVGSAVAPMIVTVAVGPRAGAGDLPTPAALAQASGSALLAGQADANLMLAHLASGGKAGLTGGDERYWRGAFVHAGRLIGLALYAPKDSPLAGGEGGAMLARVRSQILAHSPGTGNAPAVSVRPDNAKPAKPAAPGVGQLLGRLFNRQNLP